MQTYYHGPPPEVIVSAPATDIEKVPQIGTTAFRNVRTVIVSLLLIIIFLVAVALAIGLSLGLRHQNNHDTNAANAVSSVSVTSRTLKYA